MKVKERFEVLISTIGKKDDKVWSCSQMGGADGRLKKSSRIEFNEDETEVT